MKPLSMDNEKDKRQKEAAEREAKKAEEGKEAKAAELAERIKAYVCFALMLPHFCTEHRNKVFCDLY